MTPKTKTTKTRNVPRLARFSNHETQVIDGPKSADTKTLETKNKLEDYMKVKLIGKCAELIGESEIGIKRVGGKKLDKYQVS